LNNYLNLVLLFLLEVSSPIPEIEESAKELETFDVF
jgi:hypothetical protein